MLDSWGENKMKPLRTTLMSAIAGAGMAAVAAIAPAQSVEMRPVLSHQAIQVMTSACVELATAQGWRMHIAVMDTSGALRGYLRMTDAQNLSNDIAMAKAYTSSGIARPTRMLSNFAFGDNGPTAFAFVEGINLFPGGLPIMSGDVHIGGIGVSGATGDEDEQCAQAALDAAKAADLL